MIPNGFKIGLFEKNEKFIIYGTKGSGKTALLRYLQIQEQKRGNHTHFVLFRDEVQDIPTDDNTQANPVTISTITASNSTNKDYLQHWKLFIFGFIAQQISLGHQIYRPSVELDNFLDHFKNKGKSRSFRVSGGSASFDISVNPKAALQLDFTSENEDQIPTSLLLAKVEDQFRRLIPLKKKLNIYFDELELTVLDSGRRARDALLVRDLIRAAEQVNRLTTELKHGVHITLAIRSDVANIASQTGFEINKIIQDFGLKMNWSPSLPKVGLHPLAMMLARRLQAATDGKIDPNSYQKTWNSFFPRTIHGVPSQTFCLHQTWFKPRDIIRLTTTAAEFSPNSEKFTEDTFDQSKKEYAGRCWNELSEELSVKYDRVSIEGIKKALTGEFNIFELANFQETIRRKRALYPEIESLQSKHPPIDLLHDLYKVGAIGNILDDSDHQRWSFRGDEDPLLDSPFIVHRSIWPLLSLRHKKK